jgi:hypothetical protein
MRRISILCVILALFIGNVFGQAGGNDADAIIEKAIKAHIGNGKDAKKLGYRGKNKGTLFIAGLEAGFNQEIAVLVPTKFKEVLELNIMDKKIEVVTVFNGKEGWIKADGKEVPVGKDILDEFKDVGALMSISYGVFVKDKTLKLSVIGEAMVNGKPAIGVKVSREGKKSIDMYFDKGTGLMAKIERQKRDLMSGMEVSEERIMLEYQDIGGRKHPKKILINVDGKKFMEAEILEGQFLDRIDDGEFVRP